MQVDLPQEININLSQCQWNQTTRLTIPFVQPRPGQPEPDSVQSISSGFKASQTQTKHKATSDFDKQHSLEWLVHVM